MKWLVESVLNLLYPELCLSCGNSLVEGEEAICLHCENSLPRTRFHDDKDNLVNQLFWGRARVTSATSFMFFRRKGIVQHLMHEFKYKGEKEIGAYLGKLFAQELVNQDVFSDVDVIIPIPLHHEKEKKRGYNQAAIIGYGMSGEMHVPVRTDLLIRVEKTSTQTRKGRYDRWENVSSVFAIRHPEEFPYKHVLLVDDVITTGATLEACAQRILTGTEANVSIATLAVAYN